MQKVNIIGKILSSLFIALSLSLWLNLSYAATAGHNLREILSGITSMKANFTEKLYGGQNNLLQQYSGTMAIARPNRFYWHTKPPFAKSIIADGKNMYIYDPGLQQVTIQSLSHGMGNSPAMILSGGTKSFTNNFLTSYYKGWYTLRPKLGTSFKTISFKFKGDELVAMQLLDKLGRTSVISFTNVAVNTALEPTIFTFKPPKNVDIIRQ